MKLFKHLYILFTALFLCMGLANADFYKYCVAKPRLIVNGKTCIYKVKIWWSATSKTDYKNVRLIVKSNFDNNAVLSPTGISGQTGFNQDKNWSITHGNKHNTYIINASPEFINVKAECVEKPGPANVTHESDLVEYSESNEVEDYIRAYHEEAIKPFDENEYPNTSDTAGLKGGTCSTM